MDSYEREGESEAERLDRNWDELLQELRVSQTGVQILTGFLLTLPVQPSFRDLGAFERGAYVGAMSLSVLATCLLITPVAMHRALFRQRRKETLVLVAHRVSRLGLLTLALAISSVVSLVFAIVFDETVGAWCGAAALLVFVAAWVVLPLALHRRVAGAEPKGDASARR